MKHISHVLGPLLNDLRGRGICTTAVDPDKDAQEQLAAERYWKLHPVAVIDSITNR